MKLWSLSVVLLLLTACTERAGTFYSSGGFEQGSLPPRRPEEVQVVLNGVPPCPYRELGSIMYDAMRDGITTSQNVAIEGGRQIAAKLGASGIYRIEMSPAGVTGVGTTVGGLALSGSGIEFNLRAIAYVCVGATMTYLQSNLSPAHLVANPYTQSRAEQPPSQVACHPGAVRNDDTDGHCCWPGQAWNPSRQSCVGIPRCPKDLVVNVQNQSCEISSCLSGRVRAPDGIHCCWPGQTWAKGRASCVGVPISCPTGMTNHGEECKGPTS